ncbi:outer membrane protein assembly factor BamA [bacterium CG17_big_fil_post_rev_8_21_14_2_50_64_8]|nr:MAG: outer membrane protein assembly factor BamA [bacterium CG17_big_fil_post_rev_8_21_14_2_50_64_8]PJA76946.1 MAG: outer membrane protein assembly factor BamA [bacterium CG_4_9_14_3_um_filter_65_15]
MQTKRIWLLLALILAAISAQAQEAATPVIRSIEVIGARTVGQRQVVAWSGLEIGKPLSRDLVADGIRKLFDTKKFAHIYVYGEDQPDGVKLVINLDEFPRIRSIAFQGNDHVKDKDLREAFPVGVGKFANPAAIRRDLQPLKDLYYEKGYYNVAMDADSVVVGTDFLEDLVVRIREGKKVKVKSINFVGADRVGPGALRGAMKQGTTGFLRGGSFKRQQFEEDKDRIITRCRNSGFLDAAISKVDLDFRTRIEERQDEDGNEEEVEVENREELDITIHIDEGEQYFTGDIRWEGNTVLDDMAVAAQILLEKGDVFKEEDYLQTLDNLQQVYADRGYIYITVEPQRDITEHVVSIVFQFIEGQPAQIHDIRITGNTKTYDNVILREMRIFPGDRFSNTRIQASMRDIFQTGFFEDIQPDIQPVAGGDVDMTMKVKEKQTGQFMFGMAYSEQTSASGFIQVAETNFRGKGQNLGVTWQFGSRQRYVDLSFTEPWFRGTPTLVGADLFDRYQFNYDDFYESRVRGFSLRVGRRIPGTRYSRVGLRYELSETKLSDFSASYIKYLDDLEQSLGTSDLPWQRLDRIDWPQTKSSLRLTFSRNSTDSPFFPTRGSKSSYSVELAGGTLGGEIEFQEHLVSHSTYQKLPGGFALHLRGFFGMIHGIGSADNVPDWERYRLGGNRRYPLRGYKDLEVVPRGNPSFIGGRYFTIFNTEVLYPLTDSIQLLSFLDMGDVWNSFAQADIANLRKGAGFGLRVEVPMMGTIGFDYGYGFDRVGGPSWEPHFTVGNFF